ncbi:MAG: EFR1 family ferrodoxin [Vallitaleaceae bacterium]|nr:EFR1 family ferrodoxin [Vallitaleaceae bacterium]
MGKTVLYYFTGTGNSMHIVKNLATKLEALSEDTITIVPMVRALEQEVIYSDADTIGLIFPIYMTAIPIPVLQFVNKLDPKKSDNKYAIVSRIGTSHTAFRAINKILKQKHGKLNGTFNIQMPSNSCKFKYKVPTKEEIELADSNMQLELEKIVSIVGSQVESNEKDITATSKIPKFLIIPIAGLAHASNDDLYADDKCIGCGTCEIVCPSGKIRMIDSVPVWQKSVKCFRCAACINYCPEQAAQIRKFTETNGRYSHPFATVEDIANQKLALVE